MSKKIGVFQTNNSFARNKKLKILENSGFSSCHYNTLTATTDKKRK